MSPRTIRVAAAQMGPIRSVPNPGGPAPRQAAMSRILALLEGAVKQGAQLVVFPELALTTFFPRGLLTDPTEVSALFEPESSSSDDGDRAAHSLVAAPNVRPLFDRAAALGVDVSIGYAERYTDAAAGTTTDYNTAVYFSAATRALVGKYRKVHLPGRTTLLSDAGAAQQLEKHYFTPGNLGFPVFRVPGVVAAPSPAPIVGMLICNDRRWPEAWRCLGLQGAELVLCGYNTSDYKPQDAAVAGDQATQEQLALLHHHISCQGGSYANACFGVHVAKAGVEADGPGGGLIGGTVIYDPLGRKVAETATKDDELLVATLDLDLCQRPRAGVFDFAKHRRVEHYGRLVTQVGVEEPPQL